MSDVELSTLGSVVKTAYELEADTNAYNDAEKALVASSAQDADLKKTFGQTLESGASYELLLTDAGKIVELTHSSACGVVIPANAAVAFPVDTRIDVVQGGAGLLTVTITSDTLNGEVVSFGQYKALSLWKKSATVWIIFGGTT